MCISARLNPRGTTENNEFVTAWKTKPNIEHDLSAGRDFYRYSLKVTATTLDLDLSVDGRWEVGVHACTIFTRIRKYRAFEWFESTVNFSLGAGFRGFGSLSLYRTLTREIFKTSSRVVTSFHVLSWKMRLLGTTRQRIVKILLYGVNKIRVWRIDEFKELLNRPLNSQFFFRKKSLWKKKLDGNETG